MAHRVPCCRLLLVAVAVTVQAGCASGRSTGSPATPTTNSVATSTSNSVTTTTQPSPTGEVTAGDGDAGRTLHVPLGGVLVAQLSNSYWTFQPAADPAVLGIDGDPTMTPDRSGSCPLGAGCGAVSQRYRAVARGQTTVSAARTNCGEALVCPPDQTTWSISAVVD